MIDITTEVDTREVLSALARLRRKTSQMRPAMDEIAETIRTSVEQNFEKESARTPVLTRARGGVWADLAPSTLRARARKNKTGKKLQVTGQLLASIQSKTSNTEAMVGTNKKYAPHLHYGTKNMPARPFLVIQQEDVREIERIIEKHIQRL